MEYRRGDVLVHYVECGDGVPLIALHGAGVDHREISAAIEAVVPGTGYRRIYPDLPGMGRSSAEGLSGNDDVADLLVEFIAEVGAGPVLLLEPYPRATLAVVDDAGHALMHERPAPLSALLADWLDRVGRAGSRCSDLRS